MFRRFSLAAGVAAVSVLMLAASAPAHQRAPAAKAASAASSFGIQGGCKTPLGIKPCWVAGVYNNDYTGMNDRDYSGPPAQTSGGHPFVGVTDFIVKNNNGAPTRTVKTIRVAIPPGLVSNPQATPKCTSAQLTGLLGSCPRNTQVGIVKIEAYQNPVDAYLGESVYNLAPDATHCAGYVSDYAFYIKLLSQRVDVCGTVNKNPPYNLYFTIAAPTSAPLVRSTLIFWGVPGDTGHDSQRNWSCLSLLGPCTPPPSGKSVPKGNAFLTNPTGCVPKGQVSTLTLTSTSNQTVKAKSKTPVPAIDCSKLPFAPKINIGLSGKGQTTAGKHPTLTANVTQSSGQSNIKLSRVTLPLSLALDPTNSEHVCSVKDAHADKCPASTIVGSARVTTPLLKTALTGHVYLVQGIKIINGHKYRTFPALLLALRGKAAIDLHAQTSVSKRSQLVTTFSSLPDLPMSSFMLTISGGKRGILVLNGNICRHAQKAQAVFTGHNGATRQTTVMMGTPCTSG